MSTGSNCCGAQKACGEKNPTPAVSAQKSAIARFFLILSTLCISLMLWMLLCIEPALDAALESFKGLHVSVGN